ncbi:MAG: OmpH family outer membrane protein [Spirochaetaceae bacterium]|nr:MAG: OmpH family outer membrane protein [Spirochaetaceae bacterium]
MKKIAIGALLLLFLIASGIPLFADQITRVGILDIEKVYSIYFRESKAVKELQQLRADVLREISRIDEEILLLESQKLDAESRGDGEAALRLDREIFQKKQYRDDYRRIKMDQIRKRSETLYKSDEFLDELLQAIEYVAESEGFSLVLNSSGQFSQFFFFYTKEVDITELVIQELMRRAGQSYDGQ